MNTYIKTQKNKHPRSDLELHTGELVQDIAELVADNGPGDLVLALRGALHGMARQIVEHDDVSQHAHRLVEWTEPANSIWFNLQSSARMAEKNGTLTEPPLAL